VANRLGWAQARLEAAERERIWAIASAHTQGLSIRKIAAATTFRLGDLTAILLSSRSIRATPISHHQQRTTAGLRLSAALGAIAPSRLRHPAPDAIRYAQVAESIGIRGF